MNTAVPRRGRAVRVEHVMGTAISVTTPEPGPPPHALDAFFAWLRQVDADFSTYRADSLVSRVRREELSPADAGPEFGEVMRLCEAAREFTDGAFDAWHHSRDGLDPSGLVKGWSIERGAAILRAAGARHFCVNAGGDVLTAGTPGGAKAWRVGIRHPWRPELLAGIVEVGDGAVATSALYERGAHIIDPHSGRAPGRLASITVVGPSLTWADTFATAAFVMGPRAVRWIDRLPGYEALAITVHGRTYRTPGLQTAPA